MAELPVVDLGEHRWADHRWEVRNVQHPPVIFAGLQQPHTIVLMQCRVCRWPMSMTLAGKWDLEQLA
jgi:hypothetical protein